MLAPLVEDAAGSGQNARFLAKASDLAYLPADKGAAAFASELGLNARLISVDNTQAYLAQNDDHIVVAFRGTESPTTLEGLKDWLLTDAVNLLIIPQGDWEPTWSRPVWEPSIIRASLARSRKSPHRCSQP